MSSGSLRHRIEIWKRDGQAIGARGESIAVHSLRDTRYATFEYLSGRELEIARKVYAETTASVMIRTPSYGVTTKDRVKFRNVEYGIGAAIPQGEGFEFTKLLLFETS